MVPSGQRLYTGDMAARSRNNWLIGSLDVPDIQSMDKLAFQAAARFGSGVHFGAEERRSPSSIRLAAIKGKIGIVPNFAQGHAIGRPDGNADTCANGNRDTFNLDGLAEGRKQVLPGSVSALGRLWSSQKNSELIATDPRRKVFHPNGLTDTFSNAGQNLIAGEVAMAIIDCLEPVKVDAKQRE